MKGLIFLIVWCIQCVVCTAQQGVNFEHLTFEEALSKAEAEKKLIFLDGYTSWCGPCKVMMDNVFPLKEAGDFFNSKFVCIKFDMEQGEGKELRDKWHVMVYPSFFIIRPDGEIQHRIVGGYDLKGLIQQVEVGLNEKTSLLYLNEKYEKGKLKKEEMVIYIKMLSDIYEKGKAEKVSKELRMSLTDKEKMKVEYWEVFNSSSCQVGSSDFNFLLKNLSVFKKNIGREKLDAYLYDTYGKALFPYLCGRARLDPAYLKEVREQISMLDIQGKETLELKGELAQAAFDRDRNEIIALVEKFPPTLSGMELLIALAPLVLIRDQATKEELSRIVVLGDKLMANTKNPAGKDDLRRLFDSFKSLAHVGMYFQDLTFEKALEHAAEQKKMLFVDCYTSWCGPCKYMAEKIFTQEMVGDFMNRRFVHVKYDMEKGEGPELLKKLDVSAFPTFVMLKADGTLVHKMTGGGGEAAKFIEQVKEGLDSTKAFGILEVKYKAGNRDKDLISQYLQCLMNQNSPQAEKVAEELWQLLNDEDKISDAYYFLYVMNNIGTVSVKAREYLLAHRDQFYVTMGREKIDARLSFNYRQKLKQIFAGVDHKSTAKDLDQMKKAVMDMKLSNEEMLLVNIEIAKALIDSRFEKMLHICEKNVMNMQPQNFYYIQLVDRVKEKLMESQKSRWIDLGKILLQRIDNEDYRNGVENAIKSLGTQNNQEKNI